MRFSRVARVDSNLNREFCDVKRKAQTEYNKPLVFLSDTTTNREPSTRQTRHRLRCGATPEPVKQARSHDRFYSFVAATHAHTYIHTHRYTRCSPDSSSVFILSSPQASELSFVNGYGLSQKLL